MTSRDARESEEGGTFAPFFASVENFLEVTNTGCEDLMDELEANGILSKQALYQLSLYVFLIFILTLLMCVTLCRTRSATPDLVPVKPKNMISYDQVNAKKQKAAEKLINYEREVVRRLDDLPCPDMDRSGHTQDDIVDRKNKGKIERTAYFYEHDYVKSIPSTHAHETLGFHKC